MHPEAAGDAERPVIRRDRDRLDLGFAWNEATADIT
jgi:hypothetical protein